MKTIGFLSFGYPKDATRLLAAEAPELTGIVANAVFHPHGLLQRVLGPPASVS